MAHRKKYQPTASKCSFQLPSIRNCSIYCRSQRTHSCCPPTNLHTLNPAPKWAESTRNTPSDETMRDVSFESVKSHFRQRIRPRDLSRCKGGLAGRRRNKMTVFRSSTSSWWGKIIFPLLRKWLSRSQRITNTRDGQLFFKWHSLTCK